MKILFINLTDHTIPPPPGVIRADTYISVPIAEEMQKRGHQVSFICPPGSHVKTEKITTATGPIVSVVPLDELTHIPDMQVRTEIISAFYADTCLTLLEHAKEFDLVHFHTNIPLAELAFTRRLSIPCIFTLHSVARMPELESRVMHTFKSDNNHFISISNYQRSTFPALSFLKTIYHGVDLDLFSFNPDGGEEMLFAGRLRKTKGVKEAIETALATKRKLLVTGALSSTDHNYFNEVVEPLLKQHGDLLSLDKNLDRNHIYAHYQKSKLTLIPIQWEEPFGLVMIESMACGTPIVAFARGSAPEIDKDGETGFVINPSDDDIRGDWIIKKTGLEGFKEAVERIYAMSDSEYKTMRQNCHTYIKSSFTLKRMFDDYEEAYKLILLNNHIDSKLS